MQRATPAILPENRDLAFLGEPVRPEAIVSEREAGALLAARNSHGKPNADVLRRCISADAGERWIIDFPASLDVREAELYARPFALLHRRLGAKQPDFWANPHANPTLRAALTRRMRYLATPLGDEPDFAWVEPDLLPENSLLVVARDDDFALGVLSSHWFRLWWDAFRKVMTPDARVNSFPFPWPADDNSRLTLQQDEAKFALNRAARSGDPDAINAATEAAYAFTSPPAPDAVLTKLLELHRWRLENS